MNKYQTDSYSRSLRKEQRSHAYPLPIAESESANEMLGAVSRAFLLSGARIRFRSQSCFSTMTTAANAHTVDTSQRLSKLRELMKLKYNSVNAVVIPSEDQRKWDLVFIHSGHNFNIRMLYK